MVVYRVAFVGGEISDAGMCGLAAAGVTWEGSVGDAQGVWRHRVLVEAPTERQAIGAVRGVVALHGSFGEFVCLPVRGAKGEIRRGPFHRSWSEIDWQAVPRRASLTKLQRAVLGCMFNAGEPTWIIVADPDVQGDRVGVEAVLEELEQKGLVYSVFEWGGEPGRESEPDRWWAITDEGWDLLGLVKSPAYR
jgi:hypothetical protein